MRRGERVLTGLGVLLLVLGAAIGWGLPAIQCGTAPLAWACASPARAGIDTGTFLSATITALAMLLAVGIGFNAATVQIAGQTHALPFVRAILRTLFPFLLVWSLTTAVALISFLLPPTTLAQLWQQVLWFAAVVVLLLAYLWGLPWRLSGDFAAQWCLRVLRREPIARWEQLDAYSALQTGLAAASARGDLGTVRALAVRTGIFLTGTCDRAAEAANRYERERYRALKGLLAGAAQHASAPANAVTYHFGYLAAGTLLQTVAIGLPTDDPEHDVLTSRLRAIAPTPERASTLWTGIRHALCRAGAHGAPFLVRYWQAHRAWQVDDPRYVARVADAIAVAYSACALALRLAPEETEPVADLLLDLYRDLCGALPAALAATGQRQIAGQRVDDLPPALLDAVHARVLQLWPPGDGDLARLAVINAYEQQRAALVQRARR